MSAVALFASKSISYKPLKYYFDEDLAQLLAGKIAQHHPHFPSAVFVRQVADGVVDLELKDRVLAIARGLREHLPDDYPHALQILLKILGPENENETGMFTEGYWLMPVARFVESFGLDHFELSTTAIREITMRNTGEYAIRPYLKAQPERTMALLMTWARDDNFHVRRLASEGCRPRLPWATKIQMFIDDPTPIFPLLEFLKDDNSRYVQRSVANNINDILKDNPEPALNVLARWKPEASPERQYIIRHALRNELKKNNRHAQELIA